MLAKSNFDISKAIEQLTSFEISASFFVTTETALKKSIIDAHQSLRSFFAREGLHDFSIQRQGEKRELPLKVFSRGGVFDAKISLYRPETKKGDPRFWISRLAQHGNAWDLWAIWNSKSYGLVAVNCSDEDFQIAQKDQSSELGAFLVSEKSANYNPFASELLGKLIDINKMGYVRNLRSGDTGVGFTLEHLLGIAANSSKEPDYKGIEIKAKRFSTSNRVNLFSKVPLWKQSACASSLELVRRHGYFDPSRARQALYTTVSNRPNSQSLYFEVDEDLDALFTRKAFSKHGFEEVVKWELSRLERELVNKHSETFWVTANKRASSAGEEFHYVEVTHTKTPIADYFGPLVESGIITMDFTIHVKDSGKSRDHGYLFKIKPDKLDSLFPPPKIYDLSSLAAL